MQGSLTPRGGSKSIRSVAWPEGRKPDGSERKKILMRTEWVRAGKRGEKRAGRDFKRQRDCRTGHIPVGETQMKHGSERTQGVKVTDRKP